MIDIFFFIKGVIIGFCVAAPVGPIGILCIRRTLQFGRLSGLFSGLGAATADTFYGAMAAFGLNLVFDVLIEAKEYLHLLGGAALLLLGVKILFTAPVEGPSSVTHRTLFRDFISTFFLTLANPLTIVAFLAIFAGVGLSEGRLNTSMLILGVFGGASSWWLLLSEGVTLFRKKISKHIMLWINRIAGLVIIALGLAAFTLL